MIRVLIADDHPIVRAGITAVLDPEPDLDVIAHAATAEDAITAARTHAPDVVLMDLQFGAGHTMTGADATARIRALDPAPYVLILTNYDSDTDILTAIEAGASGYLLKDTPPHELTAAIRAAASGESALAPTITGRLLQRIRAPRTALSPRELTVLNLLAHGHTNADIATTLFISETTVKTHLSHIFTKLNVASRTAAIAAARRNGTIR